MENTVKNSYLATGRRKESVARVHFFSEGTGKFVINGKDLKKYFALSDSQTLASKPLGVTELEGKVDVIADVYGGGITGQAGAISLGIARCLVEWNPQLRTALRKESLLTRDPRAKERKKYGRKGARRRFQWTKR